MHYPQFLKFKFELKKGTRPNLMVTVPFRLSKY